MLQFVMLENNPGSWSVGRYLDGPRSGGLPFHLIDLCTTKTTAERACRSANLAARADNPTGWVGPYGVRCLGKIPGVCGPTYAAGHFNPAGDWVNDSVFSNAESAASRAHWLNGY